MSLESPETIEQKRAKWDETLKALDYIVDKLGKHIDPEIKEAVAALQCSGFETDGSCEGHIRDAKFHPPYVDISFVREEVRAKAKELRGNEKDPVESAELDKLLEDARREAFAGVTRLMSVLEEFYRDRQVSFERRLIIGFFARSVESTRLESQGAGVHDFYPPDLRQQKLREFQDEMATFTEFLRERFLSETAQVSH